MNSSKYEKDIFECHGALYSNKGIYRVNNIVLAICYSLESVAGVVLNVMVLLAMKRNKKLHVLSNYLLMALSIEDLLAGLGIAPSLVILLSLRARSRPACVLLNAATLLGYSIATVSFFTIIGVTMEQFLAVAYPFFHERKITLHKIIWPVIFTWLLVTVFLVLAWYSSDSWAAYIGTLGFIIFISYMVMVCCYVKIFHVVRSTKKRMGSRDYMRQMKQRNKTARTAGAIICGFTICYIPFCMVALWRMIFGTSLFVRNFILEWTQLICLANICVNPIVYCWRLTGVKKELRKIFGRKRISDIMTIITEASSVVGVATDTRIVENVTKTSDKISL